ncbi:MAG: hypothetical protein E7586_03675 [Ruminococcaceae bacterium]|nr:hypothetical protein [Oscillospiraceae bacterium]
MQTKKREITVIAVILILQTLIYLICGGLKSYIHMDEAYSLGLSNYHQVEIQLDEDFYDNWHSGEYYEDYLALQEDEYGEYYQVYENQKNDVHPPFYYLILRFAMGLAPESYTHWHGVIINIICYAFITLLSYALLKRILKDESHVNEKSALFAFLSSLTMASLSNVLYIRMYALTALNILLIAYLHVKLRECTGNKAKWIVLIGLSALIGSLTHYYYLFYLFALFLYQCYRFIKKNEYKTLRFYILSMAVAGGLSLLIFPYSIQHMFFGYQGEGFISRLFNLPDMIDNILNYSWIINEYGFNNALVFMVIGAIALCCYRKKYRKDIKPLEETDEEKIITLNSLLIPTFFYFIIVSAASPWVELRYIAAICINAFVLVFYYFYRLLKSLWKTETANKVICVVLSFMFVVFPLVTRQEPQAMYHRERADIVETIEENAHVPAIYVFNSQDNRFLDDILLFAKLESSYIAFDKETTAEYYKSVLKGKDMTEGLFVFINNYQDDDVILSSLKTASGLDSCQWIKHLNACNVYYLS